MDISVAFGLWLMFVGIFFQHCTYPLPISYLLPDQFHWNTVGSKLPVAMFLLRFPHLRPGVENPTTLRTLCQQNWAWLGASRWYSGEPVESPLNMYQEHPWAACAWACAWRPIVRKLYYRRESLGQPPLKNTVITEEIYGYYIYEIMRHVYDMIYRSMYAELWFGKFEAGQTKSSPTPAACG